VPQWTAWWNSPNPSHSRPAPDDERALRDWFALVTAAGAHDVPADPPPCRVEHRARLLASDPA
jgi:hypothetical protein